jgi:hypothetical protein
MEPSSFIKGMIEQLQVEFGGDALKLCLEVENQLIQGLADELKDPGHKFQDKFQIIADLKFCSDYTEDLLDALQEAMGSSDPFYNILYYLDKE